MAKPTALIVGGAGYFGARLTEDLKKSHVVTVTRRSAGPARQAWIDRMGVTTLVFDSGISARFDTDQSFDLVVNLAMPGVHEAQADPDGARNRAETIARACTALLGAGQADRLVHFSTFHVYGGDAAPHYCEDCPPAPKHPYGQAHHAVERFMAADPRAAQITILRPSNMIGSPAHRDLGDQAGLIFLDLCRQVAQTGEMVLRNDGKSYRDVLPFPDAIAAVRSLAVAEPLEHRVCNLAAGQAMTLREIVETIARAAPVPPAIRFGDGTDAFRTPFQIDISGLTALGWQPCAHLGAEASRCIKMFK